MSEERAGEPAYPVSTIDGFTQYGLTTRELFAAMAMQALVSRSRYIDLEDVFATQAIRIADALIDELSK
jgi:hypothetical protein